MEIMASDHSLGRKEQERATTNERQRWYEEKIAKLDTARQLADILPPQKPN